MSILTIQQITNQALKVLEKELATSYRPKVTYKMKSSYGKYKIYKYEIDLDGIVITTTLAKKLTLAEAEGMMKLLKEDDE